MSVGQSNGRRVAAEDGVAVWLHAFSKNGMPCSYRVGQKGFGGTGVGAGHCCDHVNTSLHQANCDQEPKRPGRTVPAAADRRGSGGEWGEGETTKNGTWNMEHGT